MYLWEILYIARAVHIATYLYRNYMAIKWLFMKLPVAWPPVVQEQYFKREPCNLQCIYKICSQ